jgi:hypothetical protein
MSRYLTYLVGPELVMILAVVATHLILAKHTSGEGRDIRIAEQMVMGLPPLVALLAFFTIFVPGSRDWWWLGRAIIAVFIGTGFVASRCIDAFGSGSKGQDGAFLLAYVFAGAVVSLGTAVGAAMIQAAANPAFADWFRMRPVIGSFLTLLAAVPIGVVLLFVGGTLGAVVLAIWAELSR